MHHVTILNKSTVQLIFSDGSKTVINLNHVSRITFPDSGTGPNAVGIYFGSADDTGIYFWDESKRCQNHIYQTLEQALIECNSTAEPCSALNGM